MNHLKLNIPIYNQNLCLIEADCEDSVNKEFDLGMDHEPFATTFVHRIGEEWCLFMVFNKNHSGDNLTYGLVAHECYHATRILFERLGESIDSVGHEPAAYLVQYFFDEILRFLKLPNEIRPTGEAATDKVKR